MDMAMFRAVSIAGLQQAIVLAVFMLSLLACADHSIRGQSEKLGYTHEVVRGEAFLHQVVFNDRYGERLHVYIEGDGRPWIQETRIASDPTPARLPVLELMALDAAPAIYLGRPCYFGLLDDNCGPVWWSDKRYSEEVVASMNAVLDRYAAQFSQFILIGHSGGGALAMLLAGRRGDVVGIVTLAGNLDTTSWADYHGYTPLYGSLNPAQQPPLPDTIEQWHYLGAEDKKITPAMVLPTIDRQHRASLQILPAYDHLCCWANQWPEMLDEIAAGK